jgi:hypothetical protein
MVDAVPPPDFQNWLVYVGMVVSGVAAGFVTRAGWKHGASADSEIAIMGQASITDLGPVRDLVKHAAALGPILDMLAQQQAKTSEAIAAMAQQQARTSEGIQRLASIVEGYIANQQNERENDEEVERRVADALERERRERPRPSHVPVRRKPPNADR